MLDSEFLVWDASGGEDTRGVMLRPIYVRMAGDLNAGILLSQIVYWHLPGRNGKTKLQHEHGGYLWLSKHHSEWEQECCLSEKQAIRALRVLVDKRLIVVRSTARYGHKTNDIRLSDGFMALWRSARKPADVTPPPTVDDDTADSAPSKTPDGRVKNPERGFSKTPNEGFSKTPKEGFPITESTGTESTDIDYKKENAASRAVAAKLQPTPACGTPDSLFCKFWETYPRQVDRGRTWKTWKRLSPEEAENVLIMLTRQIDMDHPLFDREEKFIPSPANYLQRHYWQHQIPTMEEAHDYFAELERPEETEAYYHHWLSCGWNTGGTRYVKDWKTTVRNWVSNIHLYSGPARSHHR